MAEKQEAGPIKTVSPPPSDSDDSTTEEEQEKDQMTQANSRNSAPTRKGRNPQLSRPTKVRWKDRSFEG